jgi:hypothetical protein
MYSLRNRTSRRGCLIGATGAMGEKTHFPAQVPPWVGRPTAGGSSSSNAAPGDSNRPYYAKSSPEHATAGSPAEGRTMAWILLISAGLLGTGFAVSLDQEKKVDQSAMGRRARTCCPPALISVWRPGSPLADRGDVQRDVDLVADEQRSGPTIPCSYSAPHGHRALLRKSA